jgi:hypothetical protein
MIPQALQGERAVQRVLFACPFFRICEPCNGEGSFDRCSFENICEKRMKVDLTVNQRMLLPKAMYFFFFGGVFRCARMRYCAISRHYAIEFECSSPYIHSIIQRGLLFFRSFRFSTNLWDSASLRSACSVQSTRACHSLPLRFGR